MKKLRNYTLFDNYNRFDEVKNDLIELGIENPSDSRVWDEISDYEYIEWEEMIATVEKIFPYYVIVSGSCGRWNGTFAGGKILVGESFRDILRDIGKDCDYFEIGLNSSGRLFVRCSHHDGTNYFEFKEITDTGCNYIANWEYGSKRQNLLEQDIHERIWNSSKYSKDVCVRD